MSLESIVNVQISRQTAGVSQAGFGIPLILGPNAPFAASVVRSYSSLAAVADDFETTDTEYLMAAKIFSQTPKLPEIKIALDNLVAQVSTLTVTVQDNTEYTVDFGTVEVPDEYAFTSDGSALNTEIVEGLKRLINGEEIQLLTFSSADFTTGSIRLHYGTSSGLITAANISAANLQTLLRTLTGVNTLVVNGLSSTVFEVVFRGTAFTGDIALIAQSVNSLEDSLSDPITLAVSVSVEGADVDHGTYATGTTTLILTAIVAGTPFELILSGNLSEAVTPPSGSIADQILNCVDIDNDWYFLLLASYSEDIVLEAAETIEALRKIFVFRWDDEAAKDVDEELLFDLAAANYFRTAVIYTDQDFETNFPDAAWVGRCGPLDPGSETWAMKTLSGVTVDSLTDTEQGNLDDKNANYYISVAGVSITINGKTCGGEYIDVMRFIDWLQARMQEAIFGKMINLDKLPFTDAGIAVVETDMRAVLERGIAAGGIASYTVTVPKAADISANDKAERNLTGLEFDAVLQGAIHAVEISGVVTL